jgi:hypothetical protein
LAETHIQDVISLIRPLHQPDLCSANCSITLKSDSTSLEKMAKLYLVRYQASTNEVFLSEDVTQAQEYDSYNATIAEKNVLKAQSTVTYKEKQCHLHNPMVERTISGGYVIAFHTRALFREPNPSAHRH